MRWGEGGREGESVVLDIQSGAIYLGVNLYSICYLSAWHLMDWNI